MRNLVFLIALAWLPCAAGQARDRNGLVSEPSFEVFLPRWERAQTDFINGKPGRWKQHTSHTTDVTIYGAFGGSEKGWKDVGPRNDWASGQFQNSGAWQRIEYISKQVSGSLAVTVAIERQTALIHGQTAPTARSLRVTQVFRKEGGVWKLLHRHADPLVERLPPAERR